MAAVRVEFVVVGGGRGRLGGQVDAEEVVPLGAGTLPASSTPTAPAGQLVVPATNGPIFACVAAVGAAAYLAAGASPNPAAEPRRLVVPGFPIRIRVDAGQRIAVLVASDIAFGTVSLGDQRITNLSASVPLAVPDGARQALVAAEGAAVRWRKNADPTATVGMPLAAGSALKITGDELSAIRFIQQSAGAVLTVDYTK